MPIHFFYGNEDFLIEKQINKLKQEILKGDINELNYKRVDNPPFSLFSELIRTNAMMFGDIIILINCPKYFLESKGKISLDDKQVKELVEGFNNISDRVHLILVCPTPKGDKKKPDSRKKLYKELVKIAPPIEFQEYKPYEDKKIIPEMKKMAAELDIIINNPECLKLIEVCGSSLRDIYNQLEKLKLYSYPNKQITQKAIEEVVSSNVDIFKIADLIIEKKYSLALNLISDILQKEHYLPLLGLLQRSISSLVKLKIYAPYYKGYDLAAKCGMNNLYVIDFSLQKIKNIPLKELSNLKINLTKAEFALKTGSIQDPITAFSLAFEKGFYE